MRKLKVSKIWIPAFLLAALVAGCGDPDKGANAGPLAAPTVVSVTPTNGVSLLCPNIAVISATFSKAMNPATINTSTFTLTDPTGANVAGTVSLDSTGLVATLLPPAASLTPSTTFTATVTTGAADTFGNHLAANSVSTFTTSAPCLLPPPSGLGTACTFGILAATPDVSNVIGVTPPGPTHVTGDVGIWPAKSVTGFPPGTMTGNGGLPHLGDAAAMTAQGDLTTAYNNALSAGGGPSVGIALTADIGNQNLPPGVYIASTTLGITGNLTLDGSTNPNGVWIFKVGSALTTAAGSIGTPASQVLLIGGAQAHNVFWVIGSSATLGTFSLFQGTIMAKASITLDTGATLNGRALAETGAIALDNNPVNVPPCP
jgi:Ice-binding-like/Bacterial Ig-like domain